MTGVLGKRTRRALASSYRKKPRTYVERIPRPRFGLLKKHLSKVQTSLKSVMTYCDSGLGLNPGAGTAAVHVFAANGLYDPNITGIGHQPTGFDQLMALYNEYVVVGSTIKVTFFNIDNVNAQMVGISLLDLSTTGLDVRQYVENGYTTWTVVGERGGGCDVKTLTLNADIRKFSTQDIMAEDNFKGTVGSNPADTHCFHIWAVSADGTTDSGVVAFQVEINYDVVFRDNSFTALS